MPHPAIDLDRLGGLVGQLGEHVVSVARCIGLVPQPGGSVLVEVGVEGPLPRGAHFDAGIDPAFVPGVAPFCEGHAVEPVEIAREVAVQHGDGHVARGGEQYTAQPGHGAVAGHAGLAEPAQVAMQQVPIQPVLGQVIAGEVEPVVGLQVLAQRCVVRHVGHRAAGAEGLRAVAQVRAEGALADGVLLPDLVRGAVQAVLLERTEGDLRIAAVGGIALGHVAVERALAPEARQFQVPGQLGRGADAAQEEVLVHTGVGQQARRVAFDVHRVAALARVGQTAPVGEALPELGLVVADRQRLQRADVAQEEVGAVEVEAIGLRTGEELLAFVLLSGDAQAEVLAVAHAVARVELVGRTEIGLAVVAQRIEHP